MSFCIRFVALGMAAVLFAAQVWAIVPDRRRNFEEREANEYLLVPAIASIPGIGTFAGLITSISNVGDTGVDLAATAARSIDGSDIRVLAVAARELPLLFPGLSLDVQYADIELGEFRVFLPGRDSPDFTIPISAQFQFYQLRPELELFDRRFNLRYTLGFFEGFDFDENGNEIPFAQHTLSWSAELDFTDDVVDPRVGVRLQFSATLPPPDSSILGEDTESESAFSIDDDVQQRETGLTIYIPFSERLFLAWDNRFFETRGGEGETDDSVIAGGSPPLRGYPAGRWRDRFGVFHGFDLRYNIPFGTKIDFLLARGVLEDLQLAVFYEVGQVSPTNDSTLYDDMRSSYGVGFRVLLQAIVLRLDLAFREDGQETHLTIGHAF